MIVQHHREERKRPSITAFTTIWADQNIAKMLVSGVAAAAATSAGFIGIGDLVLAAGARTTAAETGSAGSCAANRPKLGLLSDCGKADFWFRFKTLIVLTL